MAEPKRRTRSKSAPRVQTSLLTMAFEGSSPGPGRRSRDTQRTATAAPLSGAPWRPDVSPRRQSSYQATRALLHDVHPSRLQPPDAAGCAGRYSPCYGEEEGARPEKGGATSPHVRCRVDIKPDAMAAAAAAAAAKHQRQHGGGHGGSARSLTVPRHFSYSSRATPTATPTDSLGREYRRAAAATGGRYSSRSMPNTSYLQQQVAAEVAGSVQRMASPGDYYDFTAGERPTTPGEYFYTEESPRYVSAAPPPPRPSSYFPEECFMAGQNFTPKVCYVQDPRTRAVHAVPSVVGMGSMGSPYFAEMEPPCFHPLYPPPSAAYGKPPGGESSGFAPSSYIVQTPPGPTARTFFGGDDPRTYQIQTAPPRLYYQHPPAGGGADAYGRALPPEHHFPARAYYTEGRRHARVVQPQSDEWYGSEAGSGYSTNPPASYVSQATPTRVTHWSAVPCAEAPPPPRMGVDAKSYSRSWDDILSSHAERAGAGPHRGGAEPHRGQSYDNLLDPRNNLLDPRKAAAAADLHPADDGDHKPRHQRQRPVVVNLSSSPRRYAALSMSDNSLIDKSPTSSETARSVSGRHWFVTPEITITDNDLRPAGGARSSEPERSASWDVLDSRRDAEQRGGGMSCFASASPCRDKTQENASSLQQSLEQLDELLADLVTDYKPPSRRASEDILDQLKKLIDEEEAASMSRKAEPLPLDKQPTSIRRMNPEAFRDDADSASIGGGGVAYPDSASIGGGGGVASSDGLKSADECSPDQSPDEDDTMMCSNNRCRRTETVFNACLYFKSCHSCYTYYCSRGCRRSDWDVHKGSCLYGRVGSVCRHVIRHCRETPDVHKAFSRLAKVGFLSRGRGVLFLGFPNPSASGVFLQRGLEGLATPPTYLSLRELDSFKDNLGEYCGELRDAGGEYDPNECFLLNVSIAVGEATPPGGAAPRSHTPTVRKYAKVALASFSPERKVHREEEEGGGGGVDMETLILTPPPGTADIDREGEEGRRAREVCFINIQRELRLRGVSLRHEYPAVYRRLCDFVERNRRFTPTTVYPTDRRTGKQFMCMIMAASEPRTLDWVGTPHLLDDII